MAGLNRAMVIGHVGKDPEIRFTQAQEPVASFSIATSEKWKDRDGNPQEHTEWHRIVAFRRLAEIVEKYVSKGKQVYVEGKLQTRKYTGKDGTDKYTTEIIASGLQLLGSKDGGSQRVADEPAGYNPPAKKYDDYDLGDLGPPLDPDTLAPLSPGD